MKIILLEDVKTLGKKGEVVEVNEGYGRNFIISKKLGLEANNKNLNDLKLKKANNEKMVLEILEKAKAFAAELETKEVVVKMKAGEGGKAFGSISSKEIAKAFFDQFAIELDKKKINLPEAIKNFGSYEVTIKLHPQVTAKLKVKVQEEK